MTIKEFKVQYALGTISLNDKMDMAETPSTSKRILTILSRDKEPWVRDSVARNINTPTAVLIELSKDEEVLVRGYVATNENTPVDILEKLSKDKGWYKKIPIKVLKELSKDKDSYVRNVGLTKLKERKKEEELMQKTTIIKQSKYKLEFEKFDDFVYIKCGDREDPYLLRRKFFDEQEKKYVKTETPYNWLLKVSWKKSYVALSEDYLKQYFETGNYWEPDFETWIVDSLPLLKADVKDRFYQALGITDDGFLKFEDKPVRRPYGVDLHGYHSKDDLIKILSKNPKIVSVETKEIPHYNRDTWNEDEYIRVAYLPSVREFNQLVKDKKYNDLSNWDVIQLLKISEFKKKDYDE